MAPSGVPMPSSAWARNTASHSCRSATTLCSGLKMVAIAAEAYRPARTLGIAGLAVTAAIVPYRRTAAALRAGVATSTVTRIVRAFHTPIGLLRGQAHSQPSPVVDLRRRGRARCGLLLRHAL